MTQWTLRLIIANAVTMVMISMSPAMSAALMFIPAYALLRPWTLLTYMFVHADWGHLFFNMLALFFFGPRLEVELGGKHFLWLYFISGIMGALLSLLFSPMAAIVGASGAVYGVMLGFAFFWPREPIYIWGLMPVQSRYMIAFMTILSISGGFGGSTGGIAHFAHLGGFAGGYVYLKWLNRNAAAAISQSLLTPPPVHAADLDKWARIRRDRLHPVNREELDRILTKLNTTGAAGLTTAEFEFLNRFSQNE